METFHAMRMDRMHPADNDYPHVHHAGGKWLSYLFMGTALTAGAVILAPYALPFLGASTVHMANTAASAVTTTLGSGPAGAINSLLGAIPWVGGSLAEGGIWAALAGGGIGIGGIILSHYMSKKEDGSTQIHWSRIIRTTALITSSLIALPAVLTAISIGITYLSAVSVAFFSGQQAVGLMYAQTVARFMSNLLGAVAHVHTATIAGGILPTALSHIPHLATLLAPALSFGLSKKASNGGNVTPENSDDSILARMEVNHPTQPGIPTLAKLRLVHADTGAPLTAAELAVVHEAKIHLFITDSSLKDYHHAHPIETDEPGVYAFTFTPRFADNYAAWMDFTLQKDGRNYRIKEAIPSASGRDIPATVRMATQAQAGDMAFHWKTGEPLRKGDASIVEVTVTDRQGNPVKDLEPVMGAFAHLVGFSADGKSFIHTHPMDREALSPDDRGGPRLRFHVEPNAAGPVQFYLHVMRQGRAVYVPFGRQVMPPELATGRVTDRRALHGTSMQMDVSY